MSIDYHMTKTDLLSDLYLAMKILFDARVLSNPKPSGVGHYAKSLLAHLLTTPSSHRFWIYENSFWLVESKAGW